MTLPNEMHLKSYVIHYSKLTNRKKYLLEILNKWNLKPQWVTEKDFFQYPEHISAEHYTLGISDERLAKENWIIFHSQRHPRIISKVAAFLYEISDSLRLTNYPLSKPWTVPPRKKLEQAWLEVQRMHLTALELGTKSKAKWILVFEDDAVMKPDSLLRIERIINTQPPKNRWINLNSGADLIASRFDRVNSYGLFKVKPPSTRCAVAYLISHDAAKKIVADAQLNGLPNWLPIDFYYQVLLRKYKIKSYWTEPSVIDQGSENGKYKSGFDVYRG